MQIQNILRQNYTSFSRPYQLKLPLEIGHIIPDNDCVRFLGQFVEELEEGAARLKEYSKMLSIAEMSSYRVRELDKDGEVIHDAADSDAGDEKNTVVFSARDDKGRSTDTPFDVSYEDADDSRSQSLLNSRMQGMAALTTIASRP